MSRVPRTLACATTVLMVGAGCRALLDLPADVDDALVADSGPAETAAPAPAPAPAPPADVTPGCKTYKPVEGEYTYAALRDAQRGEEHIFFLADNGKTENGFLPGTPRSIPLAGVPTFRGFVTYKPDGSFEYRAELNDQHLTQFAFAPSATAGLQVTRVTEKLYGIEVTAECTPPVDLLRCVMTPNMQWAGAASGSFVFAGNAPAKFGATVGFEYVEDDPVKDAIAVETKIVETFHIVETRSFTDRIGGAQKNHYWFAKEDGLLVKASLVTGVLDSKKVDGLTMTPIPGLALEYKGTAEFILKSLTPKPFPAPPKDAGADAKPDATINDAKADTKG